MMKQRSCVWIIVPLVLSLSGCGGGPKDRPKLAPTGGIVRFKGEPLPKATVTFYPEKGTAGVGVSDDKGAFQVKTNGQLGAVIGPHKVTVTLAQQSSGEIPPADGKELELLKETKLPAKYSDQNTTDLKLTIPAGGDKELVLDLTE